MGSGILPPGYYFQCQLQWFLRSSLTRCLGVRRSHSAGMDLRRCPKGIWGPWSEEWFLGKNIMFALPKKHEKNNKIIKMFFLFEGDHMGNVFSFRLKEWVRWVFFFARMVGSVKLRDYIYLPWLCHAKEICAVIVYILFLLSLVATHVKGFHWCFPVESGLFTNCSEWIHM